MGDLYNWSDAAPLCTEAEQLLEQSHDLRNTIRAKFCRIRSTMEQLSLPQVSNDLEAELDSNPLLQSDKDLRLMCLQLKGDIDGELDAKPMRRDWEAALNLARELGDQKIENRASGEIGFAVFLEGDLQSSRQMVAAALIGAAKLHDVGAQMRYLSAIGTGMALMGSYAEALGYLDKAAAIAASTPDAGYQFLIYEGRLQALKGLGKLDSAQQLADEMIAQARSRHKHVKEAQVLITASSIAIARKDDESALQQLENSIQLSQDGGFKRLLADAQFDSADIYRKRGDFAKAEEMATAAADSTQAGGELYLLPHRLRSIAELQVTQGKYTEADATYDRAADFVNLMIGNISALSTKTGLITAMSEIYSEHFALLADHLNNISKAYVVLERVRGRVLTDLLANGRSPDAVSERAIERKISRLNLELTKTRANSDIQRIRDDIFIAEQGRWLLPAASARTWKTRSSDVISLATFRASLPQNELFLEYVLTEPQSYCLVIAHGSARIITLAGRGSIEALVSGYLKTLKNKRTSEREGQQLYAALMKAIPEIGKIDHITVVPDGRLYMLPFDALIDPNRQYLAESHTITYAPSASALYLITKAVPGRVPSQGLLAVGGISYDETPGLRKIATTRGYDSNDLADLPGSKDEVLAAAAAVRSPANTVLLGSMATESAFKSSHLADRSIIHLAVHGVANEAHPDRAALILLSNAQAGEDGILQAGEVAHLNTNAELVVLSACDTAVGRLQGEEGIATLSGAFLLAGARAVVSTLWSVDDTFSLYLMKRFYAHLGDRKTTGAALTAAKRDMLQTFGKEAVPFYWAGYTLNGLGDRPVTMVAKKQD